MERGREQRRRQKVTRVDDNLFMLHGNKERDENEVRVHG